MKPIYSIDTPDQPLLKAPMEARLLTDERIKELCKDAIGIDPALDGHFMRYARIIEAEVRALAAVLRP